MNDVCYEIKCLWENSIVKIPLSPFKRYPIKRYETKELKVYPKDLLPGDLINNTARVIKIEVPYMAKQEKPPVDSEILLTNNLTECVQELKKAFPEGEWDYHSEIFNKVVKKYNIKYLRFLYMGVWIENEFGDSIYTPGVILSDYAEVLPLPWVEPDITNYKEFRAF